MRQLESLARLCADGATGAIHVAGKPGGTLHLVSGSLGYATSPLVPGVGRILTASGKMSTEVWDMASAQGPGAVHELLSNGHLTMSELQLCVRSAMIDAIYFILGSGAGQLGFSPNVRHPLDNVQGVTFEALERELQRRDVLLRESWPDSVIDSAPITPVKRLSHRRVMLTDVQWELIVNADGRMTPMDLALSLGRSTFAVVLDARRLVAAGMLKSPVRPSPVEPARTEVTRAERTPVRTLETMPRRKPTKDRPWARTKLQDVEAPSTDTLLRVRSSLERL